jgi:hypothetical protein
MASLRHTSKLRKNTGQNRSDSCGARQWLGVVAVGSNSVVVCMV